MELHHRSCVLPSNAPDLSEHDSSIPSRVLQERSANRRHEHVEGASAWKRSPSPTDNVYSGRLGGYFTGNLSSSQFHGEKSEAQVDSETKRLLRLLRNCDKYTKYRDRQPTTAKDKEQRWPDHLEEAFFRALVRWPPMGRRKAMLDGQLRGRNELVADSIQRDTGEPRTRKQVSSHIQVLKPMLANQPQILVYMSTEDMGGRRSRHASSHFGDHRHRHASHSKYNASQADTGLHSNFGKLPSSLALARLQADHEDPPFTVANFDMFVEVAKRHVHDFTQLRSNGRQSDLYVTDVNSWHKQYPEFRFHNTDDLEKHQVIVCDATIKVMTMERPADADLAITFDLRSEMDLLGYESLECRTQFFENGKVADQSEGGRGHERKVKHTRTHAEFHAQHSLLRVKFGSKFWAHQMQKLGHLLAKAASQPEQASRIHYESIVRRELQHMTSVQTIYGIKDGESKCLLSILWRFSQTRTSNEAGRMTWRIATFATNSEKRWAKEEELDLIRNAKELIHTQPPSAPLLSLPTSNHHSMYPSLPLDFSNPFNNHTPQLDLDSLTALDGMHTDFSQPDSATAPSLATDYSQAHSLPSLSHSHDTGVSVNHSTDFGDANDFDFNGGHITIAGCLEPAINLGAYEPYNGALHPSLHTQTTLPNLSSLTGLVDATTAGLSDASFNDLGIGVSLGAANCYATKPSWQHPSLISQLESAAEAFGVGDLMGGEDGGMMGGADVGGGVGMAGALSEGMWRGFGEDTGVGADHRRDSKVGCAMGVDGGADHVVDFGEREGRAWRM